MDSATIEQAARREQPSSSSAYRRLAQVTAATLAYTPEPTPSQRMSTVASGVRRQR